MIIADYRFGEAVTGVEAIPRDPAAAGQPGARPSSLPVIPHPDRIREAQASGYPLLHKPLQAAVLLDCLQVSAGEHATPSSV